MRTSSRWLLASVVGALLVCAPSALHAQKAARIRSWEPLWDACFARASSYYRIEAAATAVGDPACAGELGISPLVKATVRAVAAGKYGDATRDVGLFQSRTLCLTREGARGVEHALSSFVHRALKELPAKQQRIAVHGALSLGMLSFDQMQYSRRSYWLPMVKFNQTKLRALISGYPEAELGLLAYDFDRGLLVRAGTMDAAVASMQRFESFGDGSCSMLELAGKGYACPRGGAADGKPGASSGAMPTAVPAGAFQCTVDAARSTGTRGMLSCMGKAIAGMTIDPKTSPQSLTSTQPGVRDPSCALSEGEDGVEPADPDTKQKEPTAWEKIKDVAATAKDIAIAVFVAVFDKTPPVVSDVAPLASAEGADAERGALQAAQEANNLKQLGETGDVDAYYKAREQRVTTDPQAGTKRTYGGDGPLGGSGGGACGRGSNAANRAKALYQCSSGGMQLSRVPKKVGPGGSPTILRTTGEEGGSVSGAMACIAQAGDMTRTSPTDAKCAAMKCEQGHTCPCNGPVGGVVLGSGTPMKKPGAGPDCIAGTDCAGTGGMGGTLTAPRIGGGTPAPVPLSAPGPAPSTGPVPMQSPEPSAPRPGSRLPL